jgi:hypothetical protein
VISLLIPYIRPLGIPIPISPEINKYWNYITSIKEGSIVAIQLASDPSTIPETRSSHQITILKLFERNCKIVFFALRSDALPLHEEMMKWVLERLPSGKKPIYGKDYVNLGYLVDAESTVAALASNLKEFVRQDAYGNPINSLDVLKYINTGADFDLVVWNDGSRGIYGYVLRQWQEKYGTPMLIIASSINKPGVMPYIHSGQFKGGSFGIEGSSQIEYLSGYIGDAIKSTEPASLSAIAVTFLIIFGNIVYVIQRSRGKKK